MMGPAGRTPSTTDLLSAAKSVRGPAPVHLWDPPFCGDIDIRIARDGTWFHEGTPIGRPAMVRVFANILKREGDRYFLVTPVEKVGITVDDAPFVAVDFETEGTGEARMITFITNVGETVSAGPDHPLRITFDAETGEPSPYITVRAGLEALIDRKSFYRLVELGEHRRHEGEEWFGVWSEAVFFSIVLAGALG